MKNIAMKLGLVMMLVAAMGVLTFSGGKASAADNAMNITMHAQNGSGEDGTATITAMGDADVTVVVHLSNNTTVAQPAHIHKGSCANLNPTPLYPLTNVTNGASTTEVMVSMAELEKGGYAINVHKSSTEISTYVSCGDIPAMAMSTSGSSTGGTGSNMTNGSGSMPMPGTGAGDLPVYMGLLAALAVGVAGAGFGLKLFHNVKR